MLQMQTTNYDQDYARTALRIHTHKAKKKCELTESRMLMYVKLQNKY